MEHTPEPWIAKEAGLLGPKNKPAIGQVLSSGTPKGDDLSRANARRIVACVNACAELTDSELEAATPADLREAYSRWITLKSLPF